MKLPEKIKINVNHGELDTLQQVVYYLAGKGNDGRYLNMSEKINHVLLGRLAMKLEKKKVEPLKTITMSIPVELAMAFWVASCDLNIVNTFAIVAIKKIRDHIHKQTA